jgi:hypothetical protein
VQEGGAYHEKIIQVTEALADYRLAQGEIARRALMAPGSEGRLTREQAREELSRLPYPLAEFRAPPTNAPAAPGAPSVPAGEVEFGRGRDGKLVRRAAMIVKIEGRSIRVPDDASDAEIADILAQTAGAPGAPAAASAPERRGFLGGLKDVALSAGSWLVKGAAEIPCCR